MPSNRYTSSSSENSLSDTAKAIFACLGGCDGLRAQLTGLTGVEARCSQAVWTDSGCGGPNAPHVLGFTPCTDCPLECGLAWQLLFT